MSPGFRRAWLGTTWLIVLFIVAGSLAPQDLVVASNQADKLNHFAAYFVLTAMASGVAEASALRRIAGYVFLLGLVLEAAQGMLTADRSADWLDLVANAAGIATAWLLLARGGAGWARRVAAWMPGSRTE